MTLAPVLAQLHRVIREWWDREWDRRTKVPIPIVEQIETAWGPATPKRS